MPDTFAIICNARRGHNMGIRVLGLVDRAKSRRLWWTSDCPSLLIFYRDEAAARFAANRLRKNCARVVPASVAVSALNTQASNIRTVEIEIDLSLADDLGWDSHKH